VNLPRRKRALPTRTSSKITSRQVVRAGRARRDRSRGRQASRGSARPKTRQSLVSSGFLNGKELDPDFVDFNSVNRRYHYPARGYVPFRAAFLQHDPLLRHRTELPTLAMSVYRLSTLGIGPLPPYMLLFATSMVDPLGLQGKEPKATDPVSPGLGKDYLNPKDPNYKKGEYTDSLKKHPKPLRTTETSVNGRDCSKEELTAIDAALASAHAMVLQREVAVPVAAKPHELREAMLKCLDKLTIVCEKEECDGRCKDACAYTAGNKITLCYPTINMHKCKPLVITLIHELAHCAGAPRDSAVDRNYGVLKEGGYSASLTEESYKGWPGSYPTKPGTEP